MNPDYKSTKILITGRTGTGKTTLLCKIIRAAQASYVWRTVIVFDAQREIFARLGDCAKIIRAFDEIVPGIINVVDPLAWIYPVRLPNAFMFTCHTLLELSRGGLLSTPILFAADEIQLFVASERHSPFRDLIQLGRRFEIDVVAICQQLNELDNRLRNQFTHIYTFQHTDPYVLDTMRRWGLDPHVVRNLQRGEWLCLDTTTNQIVRG